jgi:cell wall-associated NlpC family hydrolase
MPGLPNPIPDSVPEIGLIPFSNPRTVGEFVCNVAGRQVGKQYRKGVNADINFEGSFDCSGLVKYAWFWGMLEYGQAIGNIWNPEDDTGLTPILMPWQSGQQSSMSNWRPPANTYNATRWSRNSLPITDLRPGDLLGYPGHISIFVGLTDGNVNYIHAASTARGVVFDTRSSLPSSYTTFTRPYNI